MFAGHRFVKIVFWSRFLKTYYEIYYWFYSGRKLEVFQKIAFLKSSGNFHF